MENMEIIEVLSSRIGTEMTILQVSKAVGKSYAYTHSHVKDLNRQGVVRLKPIGNALLCRLDYQNEITIGMLILNSLIKKQNSKVNISKYEENKNDVVFLFGKKEYIITKDSLDKFHDMLKEFELNKCLIVHGHEIFWREIAEVGRR